MIVLDLFCGCGGMTYGFKKAGFDIIAGIDSWTTAIESYKSNYDHLSICADLTKLTPKVFKKKYNIKQKIDIIIGGPPCQGFSIAGKRDTADPRNLLFLEFHKYLDYYKPKAFVIENVIGLLSMKTKNGNKIIDNIMNLLEINYNCVINKLYASDLKVPQNRRRIIIVGINKHLDIIPNKIKPILSKENRIPVKNILDDRNNIDDKYYLSNKAISGINARKKKNKQTGKGFGAQFLNLDKPSFTISARYWKDGYDALVKYDDKHIRRLTITELKKIQTIPNNYILVGSRKDKIIQIGNSVPCKFAYYIGKYLIKTLQ